MKYKIALYMIIFPEVDGFYYGHGGAIKRSIRNFQEFLEIGFESKKNNYY